MKREVTILILFLFILPFISADTIQEGYHGVSIINYITNINDFPDYTFISSGSLGAGMCPLQVIDETGKIGSYYKFCSVSVYAIKKDKLNLEEINKINNENSGININDYFTSIEAKEVLKEISTFTQVSDINPETERTNYYSIDLQKVKSSPDNKSIKNNYMIYVYLSASLVALIVIIFLLVKKFKKKK
jgi:hypothetical protein